MDERQKMQVENLREYLKLYHQLLLLLLTVSVTFFLFSWKFDEARDVSDLMKALEMPARS